MDKFIEIINKINEIFNGAVCNNNSGKLNRTATWKLNTTSDPWNKIFASIYYGDGFNGSNSNGLIQIIEEGYQIKYKYN